MHPLDAGHRPEELAREVDRGAEAGGGHVDLARIGLGVVDELLDGLRRHVRVDLHHVRHPRDPGHRHDVADEVERQVLVERRVDAVRRVDEEDRVAVGVGLDDGIGADVVAGAGPVVDEDLLVKPPAQPLPHQPCEHVRRPAGRIGHDPADRTRRIIGGRRGAGEDSDGGGAKERASSQAEAHAVSPEPPILSASPARPEAQTPLIAVAGARQAAGVCEPVTRATKKGAAPRCGPSLGRKRPRRAAIPRRQSRYRTAQSTPRRTNCKPCQALSHAICAYRAEERRGVAGAQLRRRGCTPFRFA